MTDTKTKTVHRFNTIVIGTGAAGYNAAVRLHQYGQTDIAIVTDFITAGTSRNTGSDKQTYYKLTLSGLEPDSVGEMANTLFDGECMDGDNALVEAALSAQSFLHLVDLGVPFPKNRYGEYIGYKTDHDPRRRATSIGPYTSKRMTESLEEKAKSLGIKVLDRLQAIRILTNDGKAVGLLCQDHRAGELVVISSKNIIQATGGPAAMYQDSVFPHGHYGSNGMAFEAGAKGQNLTEWQFGLASVKPRWNVSGTYMQVLPRLVSTNQEGEDEHEFLWDFFTDPAECLSKLFLKGYQWPFDVRKVYDGSSIIDILVHIERTKGRRVWLDYRENPKGEMPDFKALWPETREYLERAEACFGTPFERLMHMNEPAVSFYRDRGVDLETEMLEIALSAQHNNGGLKVDSWWQSNLTNLFVAGEAAGSHGVYRPGGSALNSGQVGSTRAAEYIAKHGQGEALDANTLLALAATQIDEIEQMLNKSVLKEEESDQSTVKILWNNATRRMSDSGAAIRESSEILALLDLTRADLKLVQEGKVRCEKKEIAQLLRLRDMLLSQEVYLSAMANYVAEGGKSRGSALYSDKEGVLAAKGLDERFRFVLDDGSRKHLIQESLWTKDGVKHEWRERRPIPEEDDFFENVWREYREHGNVY